MSDPKYYKQRRAVYLDRAKKRHETNREADNTYRRIWYATHKAGLRVKQQLYYQKNKEAIRRRQFLAAYGITVDEFDARRNAQQGMCAICGVHESKTPKGLFTDHDHTTNEVRGLLCAQCNFGLGHFRDSKALLKKAMRYL